VRLGAAGVVRGVVVDTAYFKGNYPPFVSVEATSIEGYPPIEDVLNGEWHTIVEKSPAAGDTANTYPVEDRRRWTHVRLSIYPDGGVARLRVHGEVIPDPRFLGGTIDLLAAENGGRLVDCSDAFYASPANIILPGRARNMGEGWENARRRGGGNDYAVFALAAAGCPRYTEIDTSYYVGNAPDGSACAPSTLANPISPTRPHGKRSWRAPRFSPTPGTGCCSMARPRRRTSASTCIPTAGYPGCGCSANSTRNPPPIAISVGGTHCPPAIDPSFPARHHGDRDRRRGQSCCPSRTDKQ
jgi:allantoicase